MCFIRLLVAGLKHLLNEGFNMKQDGATDKRRRLLATVHVAKKELGLDDATYRSVLASFGVESSAALSESGLIDLVRHLERCGFNSSRPRSDRPNMSGPAARRLSKVEALLTVGKKPWSYADGMAKHMFSVEKVQWCQPKQLQAIIAALVKQGKREGWDVR
jgi:phage gp16-like protein